MTTSHYVRFKLNISFDQYLGVYQGVAKTITTISDDGRRVEFPAIKARPFLSPSGIQGHFEMELTSRNRFIALRLLDSAIDRKLDKTPISRI
jgi:hypothetical protein